MPASAAGKGSAASGEASFAPTTARSERDASYCSPRTIHHSLLVKPKRKPNELPAENPLHPVPRLAPDDDSLLGIGDGCRAVGPQNHVKLPRLQEDAPQVDPVLGVEPPVRDQFFS